MTNDLNMTGARRGFPWRLVGWGTAVALILLPLIAMQFTADVNWSIGDFIFASILFGLVGLAMELAVARSGNISYRIGAAVAILSAFLIVWVNGAVGMIGSEENPYNLLFLGVLPLALIGAVMARFRPSGMALAMTAAATVQALIGMFGMSADVRGGILSALMGGLWLLAAALFRNAARDG